MGRYECIKSFVLGVGSFFRSRLRPGREEGSEEPGWNLVEERIFGSFHLLFIVLFGQGNDHSVSFRPLYLCHN